MATEPHETASIDAHAVATLPHSRHGFFPTTTSLPKSATATWGPINKNLMWKNISFKSYSRDSGHGGSEQEDSPRIQNTMTLGHSVRGRERGRQLCDGLEINSNRQSRRAASPYNHTYTEIRDGTGGANINVGRLSGYHPSHVVSRGIIGGGDDDPVYEEIERGSVIGNNNINCGGVIGSGICGINGSNNNNNNNNNNGGIGCLNINGIGEIQVSDMSDEDGRRQSDMSRQSSRSYGDHRPLIPYSPANDRLIQYGQSIERNLLQQYNDLQQYNITNGDRVINNYWDNKLKRQQTPKHEHGDNINNRIQNNYGLSQQDHTRTVAVLDGHTVVCHLQPQTDMYTGRGVPPPSYSEC